jgi:hypothetical protein
MTDNKQKYYGVVEDFSIYTAIIPIINAPTKVPKTI